MTYVVMFKLTNISQQSDKYSCWQGDLLGMN